MALAILTYALSCPSSPDARVFRLSQENHDLDFLGLRSSNRP